MDPLSPTQMAALRESIGRHGVLVPIVVDQHGQIIDGHTRWQIADELNIDCPRTTVHVGGEDHAFELAATLNLSRRHLDERTRAEQVLRLRTLGMTQEAIAEHVGVSQRQVGRDIDRVSSDMDVSTDAPETAVNGKDGKTYPPTKRRWTDADFDDLERRIAGGELQDDIAADLGITRSAVGGALVRARARRTTDDHSEAAHSNTRSAIRRREEAVRYLAETGHTAGQIAAKVGIGAEAVRQIAKRIGIELHANKVVGRSRRHKADRIASETAIALDGLVSAVGLIAYDELTAEVATEWATSVECSLKVLSQFSKQLKEVARGHEQ